MSKADKIVLWVMGAIVLAIFLFGFIVSFSWE